MYMHPTISCLAHIISFVVSFFSCVWVSFHLRLSLLVCVGLFSYVHAPNHILSRSYHQIFVGFFSCVWVYFHLRLSLFICGLFRRFLCTCVGLFSYVQVIFHIYKYPSLSSLAHGISFVSKTNHFHKSFVQVSCCMWSLL